MAVTIRQIADHLGLSQPTVSHILVNRGSFREETKKRVLNAAKEMGYVPNAAARSMRSQRNFQVGVLLRNAPDLPLRYMAEFEFILGINQFLEPLKYVLSIVRIEDVPVDDHHASRVFREHMLDGMIMVEGIPDQAVKVVENHMSACVFLDTNEWGDTNCIRRDELHCGRSVAQAMVDVGYRRLVWAATPTKDTKLAHYSNFERLEGIRQVADQAQVELIELIEPWGDFQSDRNVLAQLLTLDTAVITNGGLDVVKMMYWIARMGLRVGVDFGLAACDPPSNVLSTMPYLARMAFDRLSFGQTAAQMLLQKLDHPKQPCSSVKIKSVWCAGETAPGPSQSARNK